MNEQPEHQDDVSGHLYIPKDERAGGQTDTEGHMPRARFVGPADEGDLVDDAAGDEDHADAEVAGDVEGHKRMRALEDAGEGDVVGDVEGHKRMRALEDAGEGDVVGDVEGHKRMRALEDAGEGDVVGDVEGHRVAPSDPINEPSAIRGRDGRGHR